MHSFGSSLTVLSIAELWQRSKGRSSNRMNGAQFLDLSMRKMIRKRSLLGSWTSTGSFRSSPCVQPRFHLVAADRFFFQTELVMNTHIMVSDLHRNASTGQEGTSGQCLSVSAASCPPTTVSSPSLDSNQIDDLENYRAQRITFVYHPFWRVPSSSTEGLFRT